MLFKRLEISGFKSFAKQARLEFPVAVSGIVGPNGSGKSNIADSIRWVLGEQSMKTLRGKKGEDLIFAGTPEVAQMGKASVGLVFDNPKNIFGLEFDEVIIGRRVYRDGANEYTLNGSPVRLKDIVELLSRVGLGASQHHIIAQGDADRVLYASPAERRGIISDALGLKIYELKKIEAERKIERTEENMRQVESQRRELTPHLKYLRTQAEKAKNIGELKNQVQKLSVEYVAREKKTLELETREIEARKKPLHDAVVKLEEELKKSESIISVEPKDNTFFEELKKIDSVRDLLIQRHRELDRELTRLELAADAQKGPDEVLPKSQVKKILLDLATDLERAGQSGSVDATRNAIFQTTQKVYRIIESINGEKKNSVHAGHSGGLAKVKEAIQHIEKEEHDLARARWALEEDFHKQNMALRKEGSLLRERSEKLARAEHELRESERAETQIEERRRELAHHFSEFMNSALVGERLSQNERETMRREIERMRIRLEEAGGVDEAVAKEFSEAEKRDVFLAGELNDLKKTEKNLEGLFKELEKRIENDFVDGIKKINSLFGNFFHEIFGGGKAEIKLVVPKPRKNSEDDPASRDLGEIGEEEELEPGIEITVDIPRKRIKSLNMLSGGERALTSIALLFAVSTVNPPPFLVLDETDAALDEANSRRYGNMLKELSKKTQLIVITHNRETMRAADVLYGVTMGKNGVSELLSIKFEEAEEVLQKK